MCTVDSCISLAAGLRSGAGPIDCMGFHYNTIDKLTTVPDSASKAAYARIVAFILSP